MLKSARSFIGCLASLAILGFGLAAAPPAASAAVSASAPVVINEVYGGGGNAGATFSHDFVELYNKGATAVSLSGWSVQYASAAATNWSGVIPLSGSIEPGGYYLVQAGTNDATVGTPLPTPNASGTANFSASNGNVALANSASALTCVASACPAAAPVIDIIGFGTGAAFAGAAAPAPGNANSLTRDAAHSNTVNNLADFALLNPPTPTAGSAPPPTDPVVATIAEIQGTGTASPLAGQTVTTTGVVTAAYPVGGFNGYVIQTEGTGGQADISGRTASDGLFVFSSSTAAAAVIGHSVTVTGAVSEFNGLTEITVTSAADFTDGGPADDPPTPITAPWPTTDAARETIESMLYAPIGTYTVSNTFTTNQFAEVGLAFGDTPLRTPTDAARPSTPEAAAVAADNLARKVTLDDGATTNYLSAANQAQTPPFISLSDPLRVGASPTFGANVIVDFRNNLWKFQPLSQVTDATDQDFVSFTNTRTPGPDEDALGDGPIKVASFNVLNYFTTLGANVAGCTSFNDRAGNPITVNNCPGTGPRGAWDAANLARQQDKIVAAINALDADVVGLMEIENSLTVSGIPDAALSTLVDALNADVGAEVWAYVPSSAQLPPASEMDVISNAIIYRPATVARVGDSLALGSESGADQAFVNAREPLGQVFEPVGGGEPFLAVVNHFKSKGSAGPWPGDADTGDGQGASNESRTRQATALRDWVATVESSSGVTDVFLLGDFNSYTHEDPLQILYDAGYVDLNEHAGNTKQSYNFGGENGSLDHILANEGALARVTGSDIWNVNAPESIALEYSRYNYHGTLFYAPDAYRSSDHDPVITAITVEPGDEPTVDITLVSINDFHGRIDGNTVKWAGTVEGIVASAGGDDVAITGAGDLVGASLFASAVEQDQPTIDVMNAIGLDASAVGNHEFDKGWADLRDRIIGGDVGDPSNALWDYLGANVYAKGTQDPVLPEYAIITINGVRVGVIGAVTEETPTLVSPAGITELDFGDPVVAVNRVAAELSDGDESNGEADVLVATFHEGAPSGSATLEENLAASVVFSDIVENVSPEVDVLFNGHTHQAYVYSAANPGGAAANGMRPVLQTGSYGDFVGKVVLTVDTTSKDVVSYTAQNVARSTTDDATLIEQFPQLQEVKDIVDAALANAAEVGDMPVGLVSGDITTAYANGSFGPDGYQATRNSTNRDQRNLESTLGGLVANALLETLEPLGVDLPTDAGTIGVVNPGGLRAELFYPTSVPLNEGDGVVTYAEANGVLPFVNNLWTTHLTGAQVATMLEQQWQTDASGNTPTRAYLQLGLSDNVSYTFDPSLPAGSRVTSITVDGQAIDPVATYKIATFSFLVAGGDNFRIFTEGTAAADSGLIDRDAWIAYLQDRADPPGIAPDYQRRSAALTPLPTTVTQGESLDTTLSYLDMTSLGTPQNTSVDVAIGGVSLGSVPVTYEPAPNGNAAPAVGVSGTAVVNITVPLTAPLGEQTLTFTVQPSGKVIDVAVTVEGVPAPAITTPITGTTLSVSTPVIAGTSEPGVTVDLFDGTTLLVTLDPLADGSWTYTPTSPLADGSHTFTATATDGDGKVSGPSNAVTVTIAGPAPGTTNITLISINDFHGRIDGNTVKWAGTVEQIVASAGGGDVAITGAGDLVGASLFASAVEDDQPTIDVMNAIGLDASAVGNHEFDKGWHDLRDRILGGDVYNPSNADWHYLGANVYAKGTQDPVLPEYAIIEIDGVRIGVIGAVTEETPTLVSPGGITELDFGDPVEAVNRVAAELSDGDDENGEADVLIATFHEGAPSGASTLEENLAASAVFTDIVENVSADVDVLFNGHTHQAYVYSAANPGGSATNGMRPVLQTGSYGDFVGKVVLTVDITSKDVVSYTAQNVARTTTDDATLIQQFPQLQDVKDIVDEALANAAEVGNTPVGLVSGDITTAYANGSFGPTGYQAPRNNLNRDQRNLESSLGGLVANALVETLEPLGVTLPTDAGTIGVVNPGGLRAELFYPTSTPLNEGDGVVTYAEANSVLPFVNNLWTTHLTGAQVKTMLEQQWQTDASGNTPTRAYLQLGLSDNAGYTFDPSLPAGSRVTSITVDGEPIDLAATYKIATFSFLVTGGDNFRVFTEGTSAADSGLIDRDAWIAYLQDRADPPGIAPDHQRRSAALTPMPTTVTQGQSLETTLSYLDMTSLGTPQNTTVDVAIGGVSLGSAPVTFTPAADGNGAPTVGTSGTAAVALTVPASVPAGPGTLTFTVQPSGKVISVPVTVEAGDVEPPDDGSESLTPLDPKRILDTRTGGVTDDHLFEGIGIQAAGSTLELQVTGRGGIPANAIGAVLNITATDATGVGYVTVYPCGATRPEASSLNFDTSAAAPNTVIAAIGGGGKVCLYAAESSVHLIADANGFVDENSDYLPLNPARLADSRTGTPTIDGQFVGGGPRAIGSVWTVQVAGRGGVPADAEIAALNVTTTGAADTGYVTVWPCDVPQPIASSVNFVVGQNVPNAVVSKLSATGTVCLFVGQSSTHLIVDVNGAFPPGSSYGALVPARLLETRNAPTVDGQFSNGGARQPDQILELTVAGRGGVPSDATGVMLNLTATDASGTGYVTAWPCGGTPPNVSSLNFVATNPRANASFMALSGTGTVCLVVKEASTQLIVDVTGFV